MTLFFLLVWLGVCAEQDARQRKISNWLTLGVALLAGGYVFLTGHTWLGAPLGEAGQALLIGLALTLPGHVLRRLGAGDVKLVAALALATDSLHVLCSFIGAGIAMLIWHCFVRSLWPLVNQQLTQRYLYMSPHLTNKYPFSPFLFFGLLLSALIIR